MSTQRLSLVSSARPIIVSGMPAASSTRTRGSSRRTSMMITPSVRPSRLISRISAACDGAYGQTTRW